MLTSRHLFSFHYARVSLFTLVFILALSLLPIQTQADDKEFMGSLDGELVPHTEDLEQIIFRPLRDLSKVKLTVDLPKDANITAGRLYDPLRDKSAILTLLVLAVDEQPFLYADLDLDNTLTNTAATQEIRTHLAAGNDE